jgi:hypothetical protein
MYIISNVRYNINQLLPAVAVNIIIVHPWDVSPRENDIPRVL